MGDMGIKIEEPKGKLGVLLVGLGAVSTTFVAGVEAVKKGLGVPIGSLIDLVHVQRTKLVPLGHDDHRIGSIAGLIGISAELEIIEHLRSTMHSLRIVRPDLRSPLLQPFDQRNRRRLRADGLRCAGSSRSEHRLPLQGPQLRPATDL